MSLRFISSGSPPTLWWDLMTDVGPPKADLDSIISGYNVLLAKELGPFNLFGFGVKKLQ